MGRRRKSKFLSPEVMKKAHKILNNLGFTTPDDMILAVNYVKKTTETDPAYDIKWKSSQGKHEVTRISSDAWHMKIELPTEEELRTKINQFFKDYDERTLDKDRWSFGELGDGLYFFGGLITNRHGIDYMNKILQEELKQRV